MVRPLDSPELLLVNGKLLMVSKRILLALVSGCPPPQDRRVTHGPNVLRNQLTQAGASRKGIQRRHAPQASRNEMIAAHLIRHHYLYPKGCA